MRADGLPYIPPCPVCLTDTPRFLTIGLTHWAIRCRDKNCEFQLKCETEDMLRGFWLRLQPIDADIPQDAPAVDPDPIAELEAMGGQLHVDTIAGLLTWHSDGEREVVGRTATLDGIRAAAARLLARVRGEK